MVSWVTGLGSFQPHPCHSFPEVTPSATPPYNVENHHPCNILHPHFFALKSFHSASCIERNRACRQSIRGEQKTQGPQGVVRDFSPHLKSGPERACCMQGHTGGRKWTNTGESTLKCCTRLHSFWAPAGLG